MADPLPGPVLSVPQRSSSAIWTRVLLLVGGPLAFVGLVSLVSAVDTDGTPSVVCGGPAVRLAFDDRQHLGGRGADCRTAARDQALGGGLFLLTGGALILGPRIRRWARTAASRDRRDGEIAAELLRRAEQVAPPRRSAAVGGSPEPPRRVEDPGWRPALVVALMALVPIVGVRAAVRRRGNDPASGLIVTRQLFLAFASAIAMCGFVLTQLGLSSADASMSRGAALTGVGAIAFAALALGPIVERPLDVSGAARLAETWRTRFFLRLGFGEAPALAGFAGALLAGSISPYLLGASATAVMFARAAPSVRNIAKDQEGLIDRGSPLSLVAILGTQSLQVERESRRRDP